MTYIPDIAPSHWPQDMREDFNKAMAPRPEDELHRDCAVCGGHVGYGNGGGWFVERVDVWGERIWSGYICSAMCLRQTAKTQREACR